MTQNSQRITIPYTPRPKQREMHAGLESHRWSVVVAHRRFGKSVALLNHILKDALTCSKPRPFYGYIAPLYNQAKTIAWQYLKHYAGPVPNVKTNESELFVEFPHNGARIRLFGADNPDSLRGLYFDGVVLDEYADMKPEAYDAVIRPALSDRKGWAVFCGTPKGHNRFYDLYLEALKDPTWYAACYRADETGVIDDDELVSLRSQMSENLFKQEYLCDFDASSTDVLVPLSLIHEAQERTVGYHGLPCVMGVDVGMSLGGDPSAIVVRQGGAIIHAEEFRLDDTFAIAGRVKERVAAYRPEAVYIDGIGWGAGVAHALSGWGLPVSAVNVGEQAASATQFNRLRDELWWKCREFFAGRQCSILESPLRAQLAAELSAPTYGYTPAGKIKVEGKDEMKKRGVPSPNLADALCLTMMWQGPIDAGVHFSWADDDTPKRSRFCS